MSWSSFALLASTLYLVAGEPSSPSTVESEHRIQTSLLVQTALQQGKECVGRGEYRTAVRILEAHLAKINGDSAYLAVLEDAYRGYIKELRAKGQTELCQRYLERLAILDPGVALTAAVRPVSSHSSVNSPAGGSGEILVRGKMDDECPGQAGPKALRRAEQEFRTQHYQEAARWYQAAQQAGATLPQAELERWAYCKLHWVTQQLNQPRLESSDWQILETEVRTALSLAPRLEYGQTLLKNIEQRKGSPRQNAAGIRHLTEKQNGWQVAESDNFRVFHQDSGFAEQVLQVAEQTRSAVGLKWFGTRPTESWSPKCDVYLHATAEEYSRATGVPADSPGHSSIGAERQDASRIHSRRIDLHVDDPNLLHAVLPHETTHVALAGQFGPHPLPRWADEGMAVLSEPYERIQRHLKALPQLYLEGRSFRAEQLLNLEDYPAPAQMGAFYGQSVTLVQYLVELRDPQTFSRFLKDTPRLGHEAALKRHYGLTGFAELEKGWHKYVVVDGVPGLNVAAQK